MATGNKIKFLTLFENFVKRGFQFRSLSTGPVLGRWALPDSTWTQYRKVDLANEDHCGCCVFDSNTVKTTKYIICEDDVICIDEEDTIN